MTQRAFNALCAAVWGMALPLALLPIQRAVWLRTWLSRSPTNGANSFVSEPVDCGEFAETVVNLGVYGLAVNTPPPLAS